MNESFFDKIKSKKAEKERIKEVETEKLRQKERERELEDKKRKHDELEKQLVKNMAVSIMSYITTNYEDCIIYMDNKYLTLEQNKLSLNNIEFSFKLIFEYNIVLPTFNIIIRHGLKKYNYVLTGEYYRTFKTFLIKNVFPWYENNKDKSNYKSNSPEEIDDEYFQRVMDDWYGKKTKTKTFGINQEELNKKRKTYDLLQKTIKSHLDNMKKIQDWKRQNKGEHPDEESTKNLIAATQNKINQFKDKFKFENYKLKHLKNLDL